MPDPSPALVEAGARAIWKALDDRDRHADDDDCRDAAQACLAAVLPLLREQIEGLREPPISAREYGYNAALEDVLALLEGGER